MTMRLRGMLKLTAAITALLLIYGISNAMDGMATRLPEAPLHELAHSTLWLLPWMLLFCSGLEDLGKTTWKAWAFWVGLAVGMALLYYLEHVTTDTALTKIAMPPAVIIGGLLPHFIRRIRFIYLFCSLAVGIMGLTVLYFEGIALLSGGSFASRTIGVLVATFVASSIAITALSAISLRTAKSK